VIEVNTLFYLIFLFFLRKKIKVKEKPPKPFEDLLSEPVQFSGWIFEPAVPPDLWQKKRSFCRLLKQQYLCLSHSGIV
jgi:hypothetical protein